MSGMQEFPRISFGVIVLNGEPFTRYNLRALYPFAHQIIVVEGAAPAAAGLATPDGHSTDGTLESLHRFKSEEDPDDKVVIITQDGFWTEKDEQSQAYAERASGDYLWQVDIDEFYRPEDMKTVLKMLQSDPNITAASFKQITFWGGFDYLVDGFFLRRGAQVYHRLFRWGKGYRYVAHRPPTVCDEQGRDLRSLQWLRGEPLERRGIVMHHYSLLFPKQVKEKCDYYSKAPCAEASHAPRWAEEVFLHLRHPFQVHNVYEYPSWLERFRGQHPPEIEHLREDLETGHLNVDVRMTDDIEKLLQSPRYRLGRAALKAIVPVDLAAQRLPEKWSLPARRVWRLLKRPMIRTA